MSNVQKGKSGRTLRINFAVVMILLLGSLLSCSDNEQQDAEQQDLKEALPGTWEAISVRVVVNSAEGTDSSYVFEVTEEEWVRRLGMKPIRTVYKPDNKYRQDFINRYDSVLNSGRGIWNVFGDTLMMIEPDATYQYEVTLKSGKAEYRSLMDWDGDGAADDEYLGIQRLISREVE